MYQIEVSSKVQKQFKKLNPHITDRILQWIETHLVNTENPRLFGKPLKGNMKDFWRYRIGDYRLIAKIED